MKYLSAIAVILMILAVSLHADIINIDDPDLSESENWPEWNLNDDTYIIETDCYVPQDETLTITGNGSVLFNDDFELEVRGSLIVNGNDENNHAVFSRNEEWNVWRAIVLNGEGNYNGLAEFNYCTFEYGGAPEGGGGIIVLREDAGVENNEEGGVIMENCNIGYSETDGIALIGANSILTLNNVQIGNFNSAAPDDETQNGISITGEGASATLDGVDIIGCENNGISITGKDIELTLTDVYITGSDDTVNGICVGIEGLGVEDDPDISGCSIDLLGDCDISYMTQDEDEKGGYGIVIFCDREGEEGDTDIVLNLSDGEGHVNGDNSIHHCERHGIFVSRNNNNSYDIYNTNIYNCERGISIREEINDPLQDLQYFIVDCSIINNREAGIFINGSSPPPEGEEDSWVDFQILNCEVSGNCFDIPEGEESAGGGINIDMMSGGAINRFGRGFLVRNCQIHNNLHDGITIDLDGLSCGRLESNQIYSNLKNDDDDYGRGIYIHHGCGSKIDVIKCYIYDNESYGLWEDALGQAGGCQSFIKGCRFVCTENGEGNIFVLHGTFSIQGLGRVIHEIWHNDIYGNGINGDEDYNFGIRLVGGINVVNANPIISIKNNFLCSNNIGLVLDVSSGWQDNVDHSIFNNTFSDQAGDDILITSQVGGHGPVPVISLKNNLFTRQNGYIEENYAIEDENEGDEEYEFNGFDQEPHLSGCSYNEDNTVIAEDPGLVYVEEGDITVPYDFHLCWYSEMINKGDTEGEFNDPDGTRNDIGAFGGQGADDFNRGNEGDFDEGEFFKDFIVIPDETEFREEDVLNALDEYCMYGDCVVPDEHTLTIGQGVTVVMLTDVQLKIEGTLIAVGNGWDAGERILFKPNLEDIDLDEENAFIPSSKQHKGLYFYEAENNRLEYFRIWGSDQYGIKSKKTTSFTDFENVRCDHNESDGFYIYGSLTLGYTDVEVRDCDFWFNGSDGIAVSGNNELASIIGGTAKYNDSYGLYVYDHAVDVVEDFISEENDSYGVSLNNADAVEITDVISIYNGSCGFRFHNDTSLLLGCHALDNDKNGIYCSYSSEPELIDCRIADNGYNGVDSNGNTAEIKLLSYSSRVDINGGHNDIWDENVDPGEPPDECLLFSYIPTPIMNPIEGAGNYWGDIEDDDPEDWFDCFKPGGDPRVVYENIMDYATFTGASEGKYTESIEYENAAKRLYESARRYEREGEYRRSIALYIRILEDYPVSGVAFLTPKRLSVCWWKSGQDMSDLISYIERFECPEEASILEDEIFFTLNQCRQTNGDFESALSSLNNRIDEPRNRLDCLRAIVDREMLLIILIEEDEDIVDNMGNRMRYHENQIAYHEDLIEYYSGRNDDISNNLPETLKIARVYPNPFNSMTNITFNLQDDSNIKLTIHDLQGREVSSLYEGQETAGVHSLSWDASGSVSGVYICRLQSDNKVATIKLVMVR
ncbi:MAG: right-handed parallel beta-helix repeat-containing protein [Candidatus Hatepunaea meridiana]|nr:right-handed parallel beta-helix repeat-containing protein [Candidatus Hatepunaea meridiana]